MYSKIIQFVAQTVKNLPDMWENRVQSLGWEDPLEKEMATHSSILAWGIPWTEEPGRLQPMGLQRVRHDLVTQQQHSDSTTTIRGWPQLLVLFSQLRAQA